MVIIDLTTLSTPSTIELPSLIPVCKHLQVLMTLGYILLQDRKLSFAHFGNIGRERLAGKFKAFIIEVLCEASYIR
jgi:hypothetical protein